MNRLVLIGNGFDLAHGLKTSYVDFIDWYWEQWKQRLLGSDKKVESDELCSFKLKDSVGLHGWYLVWGHHYTRPNIQISWKEMDVVDIARNDKDLCDFEYNSSFFQRINQSIETKGWVDIENEYYAQLIHLRTKDEYCILNKQLEIVRDLLKKYLDNELDTRKPVGVIASIKGKMNQSVPKEEMAVESELHRSIYNKPLGINKVMLLSFNYTPIAYLYKDTSHVTDVNYIHGKLNKPESIIFGYGDELDDNFMKLMQLNENECLRHIKSVRYLESDRYRRMLEFIESDYFQVCIMGHSCGNSDRTLLNTIFEHKNCISIKPYYYMKDDGTDSYIETIQNISRNFKDMKLMRDRVVNKLYCEKLTGE